MARCIMPIWAALTAACLLLSPAIRAQQGHDCDAAPKEKGVYFASGDKWLALQAINPSTTAVKGGLNMAKLAIPGGALFGMNPKTFLIFRDAAAPVSITPASTKLCVVGFDEVIPRDIQIVRMQPKKDHRELAIVQGGISHYREADLIPVKAVAEADSRISVAITVSLLPGEYLLVAPRSGSQGTSGGFDFSVRN